jgi:multiple sugar transport system permease protein
MAFYNIRNISSLSERQYVGLRHFISIAKDQWFWNAFKNTLIYTISIIPLQFGLGLILAFILNSPRLRYREFFRFMFFAPVVANVAIIAVVMRLMFGSFGAQLSQGLGFGAVSPLASPQLALPVVILFGAWQTFGIIVIYFLAALQTVPEELYDAAKIDGANSLQRIFLVALPAIRPMLTVMLFLSILGSMNVFAQSYVLTGGGPFYASEVVGGYIYTYAFGGAAGSGRSASPANLGVANAASFLFTTILIGLAVLQGAVLTRSQKSEK